MNIMNIENSYAESFLIQIYKNNIIIVHLVVL